MPTLYDALDTVWDLGYIPAEFPNFITFNQNLVLPLCPNQEQPSARLFCYLNGHPKTSEHDPKTLSHDERQRLTPTLDLKKQIPNQ